MNISALFLLAEGSGGLARDELKITLHAQGDGGNPAGQDVGLEVSFFIETGQLETQTLVITFPAAYSFNGFTALGPAETQIGTYDFDWTFDGQADFTLLARATDVNTSYSDSDENGAYTVDSDPVMVHTVNANADHVFTLTLPFGGDANPDTFTSRFDTNVVATLSNGILTNPALPGTYTIHVRATSVDPDTGGENDNQGDSPMVVEFDQVVAVTGEAPVANDIVMNFGPPMGVWVNLNDADLVQINAGNPDNIVIADLDGSGRDDVVANFGAANGLWIRRNEGDWASFHQLSAQYMGAGDLDGNGKAEIIADFGGTDGVWMWVNDAFWTQLTELTTGGIATGDLDGNGRDELVVNFGQEQGTWVKMNDGAWSQLTTKAAPNMIACDLDATGKDEIVLDFPAPDGIWIRRNFLAWERINTSTGEGLACADLDGDGKQDLIVDFGSVHGVYAYRNDANWEKITRASPGALATGDVDSNGKADVVADFGAGFGTMIYRNDALPWSMLSENASSVIASGNIDGN